MSGAALAPAIFILTYAGIALGRIPGLRIDRTGIALLGAIAMVVSGAVPFAEVAGAIDLGTILLLYALMVISAQLRLGGFYTWAARRCAGLLGRPRVFLLAVMATSALLSALLANDVVCLAFTPVLAAALTTGGRKPLPFLLGLALASNIGSAATIIGNPQNMLIGQTGRLDFGAFLAWCLPPSLLALFLAFLVLCLVYKRSFDEAVTPFGGGGGNGSWPAFNAWQSGKGLAAVLVLVLLFCTPLPRELAALALAGLLLLSREMHSRAILGLIDWHLITLFVSLFIVIHGLASAKVLEPGMAVLARGGLDLAEPAVLTVFAAFLSNLVSNVPAVMILVRFLDPGDPSQWYVLALSSTFAGNLLLIGSIANLIVAEQAARAGIEVSFREHARVGVPVTLLSLAVLLGWCWLQG